MHENKFAHARAIPAARGCRYFARWAEATGSLKPHAPIGLGEPVLSAQEVHESGRRARCRPWRLMGKSAATPGNLAATPAIGGEVALLTVISSNRRTVGPHIVNSVITVPID